MKRSVALLLVLIFLTSLLSACGVKQVNDSLTVYVDSFMVPMVENAIEWYEKVVVGSEVTIEKIPDGVSEEEIYNYKQRMNAEIMAGRGPDLFVYAKDAGREFYKMMEVGVFLDLDALITSSPKYALQSDAVFSLENYVPSVMDAGVYNGKRYVMPLTYTVPLLFTTKEKMERFGVTREDFKTYESFLDTALRLQQEGTALFVQPNGYENLWRGCGWLQEMMDIEKKTVDTDVTTVDKCMEIFRNERMLHRDLPVVSPYDYNASAVFDGALFDLLNGMEQFLYLYHAPEDGVVEMLPVPNSKGGVTAGVGSFCAISAASPNIGNAWEFVKTLLSKDVQADSSAVGPGVHREYVAESVRVNGSGKGIFEETTRQIMEVYKSSDNAVMMGYQYYVGSSVIEGGLGSSGTIVYDAMAEYVESDNPVDLNGIQEEAEREIGYWLSE